MSISRHVAGSEGFALDLTALPVTHRDRSTRGIGIFLMLFAAVWGGLPSLMLFSAIANNRFEPGLLGVLPFTLIGIGIFFLGLHYCRRQREITLTTDSVTVRARGLRGASTWSEPLTNYPGIRSRTEHHSGGKNRASYTLHIVELHHPNAKRIVKLYQSRSADGFRAAWETCCRQLSRPALTGEGADLQARAVADLDKPVRELVQEGKLAVNFDPAHPPADLLLRVDGTTLELTVASDKLPGGCLALLLVPAACAGIGFGVAGAPDWLGFAGVGVLLLGIGMIVWSKLVRAQLRLARDRLHVRQIHRWGATTGKVIPADQIEMIRVGRERPQSPESVLIETDAGTTTFGAGLPPATLAWLRDCILHVLAA